MAESEDESKEAPKSINWKLVWVVQKHQKEQEENFSLDGVSPLLKEILAETLSTKFKLSILDKYDGKANPRSHLAIFRMTMQFQDVNDFVLCKVFPSTLTCLAQKWY